MLSVGDKVKDFLIVSDLGEDLRLSDILSEGPVVLYFYPKDNTPGCTKQACAFQAARNKFKKLGVTVIGVSPDNLKSHAKFREKFDLTFHLHADEGHKLADQFGVWGEKKNYGKTYMGVQRSTFIIKKDQTIGFVWPKVKVEGHDDEVLAALKEMA